LSLTLSSVLFPDVSNPRCEHQRAELQPFDALSIDEQSANAQPSLARDVASSTWTSSSAVWSNSSTVQMVLGGAGEASVCVGCPWLRPKGPMQGTPSQMAEVLASPGRRRGRHPAARGAGARRHGQAEGRRRRGASGACRGKRCQSGGDCAGGRHPAACGAGARRYGAAERKRRPCALAALKKRCQPGGDCPSGRHPAARGAGARRHGDTEGKRRRGAGEPCSEQRQQGEDCGCGRHPAARGAGARRHG